MHRKKYRKKRKKMCHCISAEFQNRIACHTIIGLSLFLILIVVIAIAALAIYIGMEIILDGSLRITYGDYYTKELYNKTSQLFLTKAHTYEIMIEKVFAQSILGPAIKQCIIMGFKNGSLIVFYRLILDRRKVPSRIFANLEETAKKILFEEITTLKPVVFNNVKMDPKQIIVKKHVLSAENRGEKVSPELIVIEGASIPSTNMNGVSKRVTHTTPAILRRKTPTSAITFGNTNATFSLTKTKKKHRQPTVEKASRIKLQLDRSKFKNESSTASTSTSTGTSMGTGTSKLNVKSYETKKKSASQNIDVHSNTYSFVSSDDTEKNNKFNVSGNYTKLHGFGEAEVIAVPSTAEGDYFDKFDDVTKIKIATSVDDNVRETVSDQSPLARGENYDDDERLNVSIIKTNSKDFNSSYSPIVLGNKQNEVIVSQNFKHEENASFREDVVAGLSINIPTRSNIALNKPLRPKPTLSITIAKNETIEKDEIEVTENVEEESQTTEDNIIVLNTEVVTSTSVHVSYGEDRAALSEGIENFENVTSNESSIFSHNVRSISQIGGTGIQKYKNIFPRSIRNEDENTRNGTVYGRAETNNESNVLNLIIDKYKKSPSNETLRLLIEQVAAIYTKTTAPWSQKTKLDSPKKNYNTFMLTKPMNKIQTVATTGVPKTTTPAYYNNGTKLCHSGQGISEHLWCNQFVDCSDGSDEKNCTCADYLRAQFSYKKICDGIVDCWDFSDENSCDWCSPEMYVCANAQVCIEQSRLCDGNRDCPLGDDEKSCITIMPSGQKNNDITYYSSGIITVKRSGVWGKLCYEKEQEDLIDETLNKLSELGKSICKTMTFRNFVNIQIINDLGVNKTIDRPLIYYGLTHVQKSITNFLRRKNFKFVKTDCDNKEVVHVSCDNLECGIQTQISKSRARGKYVGERRSRIVGGGSATFGAWPWQAALYKEGEYQCGATLISSKWLLSAGHCFNNGLNDYWVARLGILRRSSTLPTPHEQIRPIRRIIVHPYYAEAGFINDISLLEMNSEVSFTNFVRPICLPNPDSTLLDGTLCTVIGWGQLMESGSVYPDTLQEVQLPVISPEECQKRTLFLPLYKITDGMLCAGFDRGGRDACLGDSGGPLMCQQSDGAWHLYGVTSNGNGCARAQRPGIYSKVTNYINWIDNNIKNMAKLNETKIMQNCSGHRCPLGECITKARICNGYLECSDGSDEIGC